MLDLLLRAKYLFVAAIDGWTASEPADLLLAQATFAAAVKRWPSAKITLRNGARIIERTWPADN